jgi:hypothetical protein
MNTELAPYIYALASSVLSAAIIYGVKMLVQERKEQRKEHKFIAILLYSSIYSSEKVVGKEWKDVYEARKHELLEKEEFVNG